jgi:hypothetical protein
MHRAASRNRVAATVGHRQVAQRQCGAGGVQIFVVSPGAAGQSAVGNRQRRRDIRQRDLLILDGKCASSERDGIAAQINGVSARAAGAVGGINRRSQICWRSDCC